MKYFIAILALLLIFKSEAQNITVIDKKTGEALEGVIVKSSELTKQTDESGTVNLDAFGDTDEILFILSSYLDQKTSKQKISTQKNTVFLTEDPIDIDEIVVSVNRWEQSRAEVPQSVVSISPADAMHYQPQTTADLLGSGEGIFIQKSQMGGGSPMIRGFSANRLLIVVDGVRMNNAIYRSGNLQNVISIDANSLENTEVVLGPGTVIYGSDALGGVMSFSTLKPRLSTTEGITPNGAIMTRYASANFEKTIHANINLGGKKWAALISSTFTDYDDLRMGSNVRDEYKRPEYVLKNGFDGEDQIIQNSKDLVQRYTGYNQFNILGKLRYRPLDKTEMILSANHSQTSNVPRYDRLIRYKNDKLRYAEWYYGPQIWTMFNAQLNLQINSLLADRMKLQGAFQKYEESRYDRNLNDPMRSGRKEDLSIFSFNMDLGKNIDEQNELFNGLESYYNLINSSGTEYNLLDGSTASIPSRYPGDSDYGSAAAYLSYKHRWEEKLIVQAGTRYTYTWMSGTFSQNDYGFPFDGFDMQNSALIGNLGAVWHPASDWQINMDISTGFRSPNLDDVAKVFDSEPGNVIVPNPDLEPEYTRSVDMEIKKTFAGKASIKAEVFYTRLKNAMVRRDFTLNGQDSILYDGVMSKVQALVNADEATIYGGTFGFDFIFSNHIRTEHDITITKGEDSDGYAVRHVPPTFGSSHLIFENYRWFADLYVIYNGEIAYENLAPSEQDKPYMYAIDENGNPYSPAWWTLNLKGNYKVSKACTISGGIENILDKGYRPYSSGVVSPGVNLVFSVLVKI